MSTVKVKICGVNDADFAVAAERHGADYLGFVFAEESPRRVTPEFVASVRRRLSGSARCVGVFTTANVPDIVICSRRCGLGVVQLHRRALREDVAALKAAGLEVWTLAGGAEGDATVFDSSHGDGETELRPVRGLSVLAGGISRESVAEAVARGADVIDVSGSLESSRGVKSVERLDEFFTEYDRLSSKEVQAC